MAEEIKEKEVETKIHDSEVKKIKEPDFSKEVVIDRVHLLPKYIFDQHYQTMKKTFKDVRSLLSEEEFKEQFDFIRSKNSEITDEQIEQAMLEQEIARRINSLVIRDAIFNEAMKILISCYEIKINQKDIESFADVLRKIQPGLINAPKDYVELMAKRSIEKELIFAVLAKEWNIQPTDEDAKNVLMGYYKTTNESVREKLEDPKELEKIKTTLSEQVIANRICSLLKYRIDFEAINKHAEEDKKRAEEFLKQAQAAEEQKAKEEKK